MGIRYNCFRRSRKGVWRFGVGDAFSFDEVELVEGAFVGVPTQNCTWSSELRSVSLRVRWKKILGEILPTLAL